ncbi:MAG: purine-nucleoside phosphorylase [Lachnospiraceae bacterium]|nr:purine-nucleoside phosphorylase [Lachnospiraceae bacterium]
MNPVYEKLKRCEASVRERTGFVPRVALVLGSGLGDYAERLRVEATIDYKDIEGFPVSTAPGHAGRFVFGYAGETPVVCMQGRVHFYEGYDMTDVVLPIRLMKLLGAEIFFVTNASGGIKPGMDPGDLMLITDQISMFVPSPLMGQNIEELGSRFPDMSSIYDEDLRQIAKECAEDMKLKLHEGVYVQTKGPNYESPAEANMLRILGADAVGMSTCCEALAANHMGMRIIGISCICNLAAGISPVPLSEQDVIDSAQKASKSFSELVTRILERV